MGRSPRSRGLLGASALVFLAANLGLGSCSSSNTFTVANQGTICAGTRSTFDCTVPIDFSSGQPIKLRVDFGLCLSGSCTRFGGTSCRVTRSGSTLEVSAEGSYSDTGEETCTIDCRHLQATCETETLPDGNYEIHYAGKILPISIPSTRFRWCTSSAEMISDCCDSDADCAPGEQCRPQHICNNTP